MIVFALLAIGAVLVAVGAGIRILDKEYLPLLRELKRSQAWQENWEGPTVLREEEDE